MTNIDLNKQRLEASNNIFLSAFRVYYQDTDAGKIVYHANYLNFAERARHEMLIELMPESKMLEILQAGDFALTDVEVKYKKPAKLYDTILIETKVVKLDKIRLHIQQNFYRFNNEQKTDLLASVNPTLVFINKSLRPTRIPEKWFEAFKSKISN